MDIFSLFFFSSFSFTPVTLGCGSALLKHLFNSDLVSVWEWRENGEDNSFISGQGGGGVGEKNKSLHFHHPIKWA